MSDAKRMSEEEFERLWDHEEAPDDLDASSVYVEARRARESELRAYRAMKLSLQHVGLSMPPAPEGVRAIGEMKAFVEDFERSLSAEEAFDRMPKVTYAKAHDVTPLVEAGIISKPRMIGGVVAAYCPEHRLDQPHKDCPTCNPDPPR